MVRIEQEAAQQRTTRPKKFKSVTNENILIQAKQDYLDGLLDLYSYQSRLRSLCYRYIKVQINIHDIGISIVDNITREEILYTSYNKSEVIWTETKRNRVKPLSHSINTYLEELYTIHVRQFTQEFVVQIDQSLIAAILAFLRLENIFEAPTINMNTDLEQIQKPLNAIIRRQIESRSNETEVFFDIIHLSSLKIHFSLSKYGPKPSEELLAKYPLVEFLLQILNVGEVQDIILCLDYYERNHEKFTTTKITNEISSHYQNQFMKQFHALVFGLDALGNSFGVICGLPESVESFFFESYKDAIEGPLEFAEVVVTGSKALFGSVVGGAVSKITSVLGKDLANLTFYEDFVDGVKDVVTKPVRGAKHGGTTDFIKGLGQGVVNLVTRPTGGVVNFASISLDLIK
ncbi:unnamed protein product, partial [Rotaria sp. Silwood1]